MAKAKLRAMGVVPWLLLLGWVAFAASLEPPVLRGSGVRIREPAAWTGGALVWVLLICTPTGRIATRSTVRAAVHILLLAKVALELAVLAWLLDFDVAIAPGRAGAAVAAGWFFAVLSPMALAAATSQMPVKTILMITTAGPAAVALTALWAAPPAIGPLLGGAVLSLAAAALVMIGSRPDSAGAFARTHA